MTTTPLVPRQRRSDERAAVASSLAWQVLVTPAAAAADNMALDEALLGRAAARHDAVLRIYGWSRPALSLGRNQPARGRYDAARAREMGIDIVRRPTGGRAVLHWREITYSVTAPAAALGDLRESYGRVNRLLIDGLRRLGVRAREGTGRGRAPRPSVAPCFEAPVAGEIEVDGRKLVGSAQLRDGGALLQHGSILVDDDQSLASALCVDPVSSPPPAATLRALLGHAPSLAEVADALTASLRATTAAVTMLSGIDETLRSAAHALRATYEDDGWTWRR